MKKTVLIVKKIIGILILLASLTVFLYPNVYEKHLETRTNQIKMHFIEQYKPELQKDGETLHAELLAQAKQYNKQIYAEKQTGMVDAWSLEQNPISVSIEDDLFGYIEIPDMEITLPLYLGATAQNMGRGAAVLGQTSLPIGGEHTNSVIVGHRGWHSGKFFLDIENISIGSKIRITNPWETLEYAVSEIRIIQPSDLEAIEIQEGKDMVTLVTCHPYLSHGRQRYVVYCERIQDMTAPAVSSPQKMSTVKQDSSVTIIRAERYGRYLGAVVIVIVLLRLLLPHRRKK